MINLKYTYNQIELALDLMKNIKEQMEENPEVVDIVPGYIYDKVENVEILLNEIKRHIGYEVIK